MISFELSEEQHLLVETVGKFAENEMRRCARDADESTSLPSSLLETGWGLGLLPSNIPEAYGGFGAHSPLNGVLAYEALGYGDLSAALALTAPAAAALPILLFGTDEQKREWLPRFADEAFFPAAAALIEPRPLFDPRALQTTAHAGDDGFLLNGTKCLVPLADRAEVFVVYADEGGTTQGYIVPKGTGGVSVGARECNLGIRGLPTFALTLKDAHVPAANRLGGAAGCDIGRILSHSKLALAAMAVGVAKGAYEHSREYAKQRETFGSPIATRQAIAFLLAEAAMEIDGVRLMVWEAAWRLERGLPAERECYLAKQTADDMAFKVTDDALQVLGGHGYIRDNPEEMWLRNARGFVTLEGLTMV